ncbi:SDR family oxidoreductase [Streptomyces sp. BA2]|uniref:SDR family oxidoreductase n=1 Tax=Streptomyces sp. BA2 TaxID=436595 RepID=UPI001327A093|nr:SDR family oxidoreductase [Streptomyces sp. BA2]MWA08177.1 NAD-dependent epimerase/dehydratase family protein [Streptomyces sp. BA2]
MPTIVLSGATGFLGAHLMARMLSAGVAVLALTRGTPAFAGRRLVRALHFAGLPAAGHFLQTGQLRVVPADLHRQQLGAEPPVFQQLADEADEIWHSAACTDLQAPWEVVSQVNVDGTRRMLHLAAAGRRRPRFVHISTAFVAGGRPTGMIGADALDASHGFLTPYEESKYHAEQLVRAWAAEGRRALVLRPSTLLSDRPPGLRGPRHPHAALRLKLNRLAAHGPHALAQRFGLAPDAEGNVQIRLPGRPDSLINLTPVEYAADAMIRLARADSAPGTTTHHVVHPADTPLAHWLGAMAANAPWVRTRIVGHLPDPTSLETFVASLLPGSDRYSYHRRHYERTALDLAEQRDGAAAPPALDATYLKAALSSPARPTTPLHSGI